MSVVELHWTDTNTVLQRGVPVALDRWAAMRDCVSLGREHKYSALQSEYHYTKNRDVLVRAMDADGQTHSKE